MRMTPWGTNHTFLQLFKLEAILCYIQVMLVAIVFGLKVINLEVRLGDVKIREKEEYHTP
jgi:hypothetical protein